MESAAAFGVTPLALALSLYRHSSPDTELLTDFSIQASCIVNCKLTNILRIVLSVAVRTSAQYLPLSHGSPTSSDRCFWAFELLKNTDHMCA